MTSVALSQPAPDFKTLAPDNWKLAIAVGLVVSVLATLILPADSAFWVVGAMWRSTWARASSVAVFSPPPRWLIRLWVMR